MSETQYYVDQHGHQYYLDQNGQPVYIDPIQPAQPASTPQQTYVEPQPVQPQPQPAVQAVPQQQPVAPQPVAEPVVDSQFAPPEDYDQANVPLGVEPTDGAGKYADQYGMEAVKPKSKMPMILALVGSIGVGGAGAYVYNSKLAGDTNLASGSVPLIRASTQTAKVKPKDSGGKVFQNTNKSIYDRIGGEEKPQAESLRAKAEQPETSTVTLAANARAKAQKHVKTALAKTGAPRPVQTYVVLPDGRVIKPGSKTAAAKEVAAPVAPPKPKIVKKVVKPVGDKRLFVNKDASVGANLRGSTPQRIEMAPETNGKFKYKPRRIASTAPAVATPAAPKRSDVIAPGDFLLQLAARRSHNGAMDAFSKMKQQYSTILGTYSADIQKADLGAKGIYYRVRVGPIESRSAAMDVCQQLKDAGGDCLIRQK